MVKIKDTLPRTHLQGSRIHNSPTEFFRLGWCAVLIQGLPTNGNNIHGEKKGITCITKLTRIWLFYKYIHQKNLKQRNQGKSFFAFKA